MVFLFLKPRWAHRCNREPAKFVCQSPNIFVDAYLVTVYPEHGCKFRVEWTFYTLQLAWFQLIPWWNVGVVFRLCTCCVFGQKLEMPLSYDVPGNPDCDNLHSSYFVCNIQNIKMEVNLAATWNILRNVTQTVVCSYTYTSFKKRSKTKFVWFFNWCTVMTKGLLIFLL